MTGGAPFCCSRRPKAALACSGAWPADPLALAQVARAALELMHYRDIDAAVVAATVDDLAEAPDARCVVGCYRCLLSYYNQPDHELIDRTDRDAKAILLRLARCQVAATERQVALQAERQLASGAGGLGPSGTGWRAAHGTKERYCRLPGARVWQPRRSGRLMIRRARRPRRSASLSLVLPEAPGRCRPPHLVELLGEPA